MESPDVELDIGRDEKGRVTYMAYKVTKAGEEGERVSLELCEMASEVFRSEGPEDHGTYVDVGDVTFADVFEGEDEK